MAEGKSKSTKTPKQTPTKTDHLKEDPPVPGQNWAVVSFVNPKDHVLGKLLHYANSFMVADINKTITAQAIQMVRKLSVDMRSRITETLDKLRYSLDEEDKVLLRLLEKKYGSMVLDEDEYVESCRRAYELDPEEITDRYKIYLTENRTRLNQEYDNAHGDVTSLRGFKMRANFSRLEDAHSHAKKMRDVVEPGIHAFVAPVGTWFPVDMEADEVQDQDYMLPELNDLMGKYHEGIRSREAFYQERKREMQESGDQSSAEVQRERMRDKLREKRNATMKQEIEAYKTMGLKEGAAAGETSKVDKKKKRKHHKKRTTEPGAEQEPPRVPDPVEPSVSSAGSA